MINLLPDTIKRDIRYAKLNVLLVKYSALLVVFVLVIISLTYFGSSTLSSSKSKIESALEGDRQRAAQLSPIHEQAKGLSATVDTIGSILDQEIRMSLLLQEVGALMPSGAKLASLNLSSDTSEPVRLTVELEAADRAGVLQKNIQESGIFLGADIINVTLVDNETAAYPFAGDVQAYYNPDFSLADLGKPVEEAESTTQDEEQTQPTEGETQNEEQETSNQEDEEPIQ